MKIVKVTRNFQVTIPAEVREAMGIKEGDLISFSVEGDKIILVPIKRRRLTYKAGFKLTVEEMERAVEEMLNEATD